LPSSREDFSKYLKCINLIPEISYTRAGFGIMTETSELLTEKSIFEEEIYPEDHGVIIMFITSGEHGDMTLSLTGRW
jgi:hypothetical protein